MVLLLVACNNSADHSGHADTTGAAHQHTASDEGNTMGNKMNQMMRSMHNIRMTGNNNIDYATMMIEHHRGAVEMSNGRNPSEAVE